MLQDTPRPAQATTAAANTAHHRLEPAQVRPHIRPPVESTACPPPPARALPGMGRAWRSRGGSCRLGALHGHRAPAQKAHCATDPLCEDTCHGPPSSSPPGPHSHHAAHHAGCPGCSYPLHQLGRPSTPGGPQPTDATCSYKQVSTTCLHTHGTELTPLGTGMSFLVHGWSSGSKSNTAKHCNMVN